MRTILALLLALPLAGCSEGQPRSERAPPPPGPVAPEPGKDPRVEERLHASVDRVNGWTRELDAGRSSALDRDRLDRATERLRACTQELERLRQRARQPKLPPGEADDLEREALRVEASAEKAYREGLEALGRTDGP